MKAEEFLRILDSDFYVGVPDSQLKPFCDCLMNQYGISSAHMIAANEGNAVGLAAGHYLATGKVPVIYMQNSGIGNAVNPMASLINEEVYAIPCIFVVGWRGEPGVHDEPQHLYQGKVTLQLLEDMGIKTYVVDPGTTSEMLKSAYQGLQEELEKGKSVAFVIRKGALSYAKKVVYQNPYVLFRESILECITKHTRDDVVVSTTGKASRELFEIRERAGEGHSHDFLTVGSMGHSSSLALKLALEQPQKRVWCLDGDGAVLMHMGALALVGSNHPRNLIHVLINNQAHETVGGMPTVAGKVNFAMIAGGCGYERTECAENLESLERILSSASLGRELTFIEVKCAIGARPDLGRPTIAPRENKAAFMRFIQGR